MELECFGILKLHRWARPCVACFKTTFAFSVLPLIVSCSHSSCSLRDFYSSRDVQSHVFLGIELMLEGLTIPVFVRCIVLQHHLGEHISIIGTTARATGAIRNRASVTFQLVHIKLTSTLRVPWFTLVWAGRSCETAQPVQLYSVHVMRLAIFIPPVLAW